MAYTDSPTVLDLYSAIRKEMRVDRTGRIWDNADLLEAINQAIYTLQTSINYNWQDNDSNFMITTVAGQAEYDLPEATQSVRLVEYNNNVLSSTTKLEVQRNYKSLPVGTPGFYYIYDRKIGLSPTPTTSGQTVTVYEQEFLPTLTSDTDIIPFPGKFKKALVLYASYDLFSQTSDDINTRRANNKKIRFEEELNKIRLSYWVPDSQEIRYKQDYIPRSATRARRGRYYFYD